MSDEGKGTEETATPEQTFTAEDVKTLQERARRFEGMAKDFEKKYQETSSILKDVDLEEYRTMKEKQVALEKELAAKDPAKAEERFQREMDSYRRESEGKLKKLEEENLTLKKQNKTLSVTDKVFMEVSSLFNPDAQRFIKREIEERCDRDDDGTIIIKDENGDILYSKTNRVLPMTPKEYGEYLAEQYPSLAKPTGTSGTKDTTTGTKTTRLFKLPANMQELNSMPNPKEVWSKLTPEQKRAISRGQLK